MCGAFPGVSARPALAVLGAEVARRDDQGRACVGERRVAPLDGETSLQRTCDQLFVLEYSVSKVAWQSDLKLGKKVRRQSTGHVATRHCLKVSLFKKCPKKKTHPKQRAQSGLAAGVRVSVCAASFEAARKDKALVEKADRARALCALLVRLESPARARLTHRLDRFSELASIVGGLEGIVATRSIRLGTPLGNSIQESQKAVGDGERRGSGACTTEFWRT